MNAGHVSAHTGSARTSSGAPNEGPESVGPRPSAAGASSEPAPAGCGPRVAAVIVNYRQPELTREAIDSVLRSEGVCVSVWLVENAGAGQWARKVYDNEPRVEIIANPENIGFGAACNQGIDRALAEDNDFIFLLNNDATVDLQTLTLLATASSAALGSPALPSADAPMNPAETRDPRPLRRQSGYGASETETRNPIPAPKILLPDGRLYAAGGLVELGRARARNRGIYEPDRGQYDRREPVDFASACALMIPRGALEGGIRFHEPYFLYYEDADLCLRLRKAGFPIIYEPRARVVHHESASTPQVRRPELLYYETRNRLVFLLRHAGGWKRAAGMLYLLGATTAKLARRSMRRRFGESRAMLRGLIDGVRGQGGPSGRKKTKVD